ncbi:hypothetical protein [Streptomyces anulatus]|uniref:hypothetical protein n=1 Tax=Streptomyces anulatus TaxID=1892 RepID=UPI0037DCAFB7|nr:hypothetical protein OHB50_39330 [Streptomyces anulatus]
MVSAIKTGQVEHAVHTEWEQFEVDAHGLGGLRQEVFKELLQNAPCLDTQPGAVRVYVQKVERGYTGHAMVLCANSECVDPQYVVMRFGLEAQPTEAQHDELEGRWFVRQDMGLHPLWRAYENIVMMPTARFERRPDYDAIAQVYEVSQV